MKFACPKCNTRYNVPDEKLPAAQTLRLTCKSCKNVIRVRRKGAAQPQPSAPSAAASAQQPFHDSTRVASLDEIRRMQHESAQATPQKPSRTVWYVLIEGKQRGPLAESDVLAMLERQEIDGRTYGWRAGMSEWLRVASIPELTEAVQTRVGAARSTQHAAPPTPPPDTQDAFSQATVAMNAAQLQQEIDKVRNAEPQAVPTATRSAEPSPLDQATAAMNAAELQKEIDKVRDAEPQGDYVEALSALGGVPTGETMGRTSLDAVAAEDLFLQGNDDALQEAFPGDIPFSSSSEVDQAYTDAPPGEATRVFMATAGLYRRKRNQRLMAAGIALGLLALAVPIALDIAGFWTIPGMGVVYDITGMEDPSQERAAERVETKLAKSDLDPEERRQLREKLMGLRPEPERSPPKTRRDSAAKEEQGIADAQALSKDEQDIAASIFADTRKKQTNIALASPNQIRTPNLPDGLTQESIFEVINEGNRAMKLCVSEAMRKNETLQGKMEVELTIHASGKVGSVSIVSGKFRNSVIGQCTAKRIKNWRFPAFNGEPVTVIFPYVLSAGF